ncbi:MAG: YgeY family selenium metabolism-linked hydrolase [Symbiobacteriaceae bacterium]|nr:YgeY family selenium metabolism-linked hydrolase [Symbiobacteriaceae bacterium]
MELAQTLAAIRDYQQKNRDEIIVFAGELVRIPSQTGQEEELAKHIAAKMMHLGYDEVEIDAYGSVIGRVGSGPLRIIADAHIDTVAVSDAADWLFNPYAGVIHEGKLYGRGASDMKAAVAAIVYAGAAMKELALLQGKSLYISTSVLEEDYDGEALYHICQKVQPQLALICEPTNNILCQGQKGRAVLEVHFNGISAHGSAPEDGDNAVYKTAAVITAIEELGNQLIAAKGEQGSLALTRIESEAVSLNAIPTRCTLYLDRRLVVGQDYPYIEEEMNKLLSGTAGRWQVHDAKGRAWTGKEVVLHSFLPAWEIALDHPLARSFTAAYRSLWGREPTYRKWDFSTNGVATAKLGIPTIGFGPGDDKMAHLRDEYASVDQIGDAVIFYALALWLTPEG